MVLHFLAADIFVALVAAGGAARIAATAGLALALFLAVSTLGNALLGALTPGSTRTSNLLYPTQTRER